MDLPEVGDGSCCMGAAAAFRCTCWEPEYDLEQAAIVPGAPPLRTEMCADCAYRPDSPERTGDDRYKGSDEGELDEIVESGRFYCHGGMRKIVAWVHPPTGTRVLVETDAYEPPVNDGVAYQANGEPAALCAGWAARRLRKVSSL